MNFEDFKNDPQNSVINLSLYDPKNNYGDVYLSQSAINSINKSVDMFGINQISLNSTNELQQGLNLIMLSKVVDGLVTSIKDNFKALGTDEINKVELGDISKLSTKSETPSQIFEINGLDRFIAVINDDTKRKFNASSNFLEVNARATVLDTKAKSGFENDLRWDFATKEDMVKGSFSNISKLVSNVHLQDFLINTPRYIDSPINFSYRAKKNEVLEFIKPNLGSIFGGNDNLANLNDKLHFIIDVFKQGLANNSQDFIREKLINELDYPALLDLKNKTERLMQVLQLNENSEKFISSGVGVSVATSQKSILIENAPILAKYKDEVKDVLTPVLNDELERSVKISSAEKFIDAPKSITYITRLDKPLQLEEITALTSNENITTEIKKNLENKQKINKTSDLGDNINMLKKM
jgi:hypothetical protein